MKKHNTLNNCRSAYLDPIRSSNRPNTFRKMIKFRNPANGMAAMNPKQNGWGGMKSVAHSRHFQSGPIAACSQQSSPIKEYVKEHIGGKKGNGGMTIRPTTSKGETESLNETSTPTCMRLEEPLVQSNNPKSNYSLEELQRKVQHLLQLNLQRCKLLQGKGQVSTWLQTKRASAFETQLLEIEQGLKEHKEDENISQIITKIDLIEQTLAGQSCEGEAMKRSYFNKTNQSFNTTSHQSRNLLKQSLKFNTMVNTRFIGQELPKSHIMRCSSTTKEFYKRPSREYYVSPVATVRKYEPNRQKLPSSSYSRQYQQHRTAPIFPKRPPSSRYLPDSVLTVKTSTYQNQYTDKTIAVKQIDYRDLDCHRNKLKNVDISFMESSRKSEPQVVQPQLKNNKIEKQNKSHLRGMEYKQSLSACSQFYKTQQSRHFVEHKVQKELEEVYKSIPKNTQLLRLKENFRLMATGM